jgi:hypothetical protein
VASPLYVAMRDGLLVRFEEITRCPPEIQDTLVSILSGRTKGDVLNSCGKMPSLRKAGLPGSCNLREGAETGTQLESRVESRCGAVV